jgi:hypothetical protein
VNILSKLAKFCLAAIGAFESFLREDARYRRALKAGKSLGLDERQMILLEQLFR